MYRDLIIVILKVFSTEQQRQEMTNYFKLGKRRLFVLNRKYLHLYNSRFNFIRNAIKLFFLLVSPGVLLFAAKLCFSLAIQDWIANVCGVILSAITLFRTNAEYLAEFKEENYITLGRENAKAIMECMRVENKQFIFRLFGLYVLFLLSYCTILIVPLEFVCVGFMIFALIIACYLLYLDVQLNGVLYKLLAEADSKWAVCNGSDLNITFHFLDGSQTKISGQYIANSCASVIRYDGSFSYSDPSVSVEYTASTINFVELNGQKFVYSMLKCEYQFNGSCLRGCH